MRSVEAQGVTPGGGAASVALVMSASLMALRGGVDKSLKQSVVPSQSQFERNLIPFAVAHCLIVLLTPLP